MFAGLTAAALALFAARRLLFLAASLLPSPSRSRPSQRLPTMLVVLPARNEAAQLPRTLAALERLDYPAERLSIVLVDDGSADRTGEVMKEFASSRCRVGVVSLSAPAGKVEALNAGIAGVAPTELVAVCDADRAPEPQSLRRLAAAFADPSVGAVTGYVLPANADRSVVSRYAAVEAWVHQLVTSAAKDRLDLNPPMLGGGSVYRRDALDAIGGFSARGFAEDLESTVALTRAGWRTRFLEDAVFENVLVETASEYWHQHVRWARGVFSAVEPAADTRGVPLARRVESVVLASGYLDRVALLTALVLAKARVLRLWVPIAYLAVTGAEVLAAVLRGGAGLRAPRFVIATAVCFPLDVAASVAAAVAHLSRRPLVWRKPRGGAGGRATAGR